MRIVIMFTNGIMDGTELTATDNGGDDFPNLLQYGNHDDFRAILIYRLSRGKVGYRFPIAPREVKTFAKYPFHLKSSCPDLQVVCTADYEFRRNYEYEITEQLEEDDEILIHAIATGRVLNSSVVRTRYASPFEDATLTSFVENP